MKDKKIIFGITLAFIFLASVGFSYAYFSNSIVQNEVKDQVVETGTLQLTYTDGPEINIQNMKPGNTINKTITVKNTGSLEAKYNIIWQELTNEITNDEMLIEGTCTSTSGNCDSIESSPISDKSIKKNISIASGVTHTYNLTITFKDTNASQNYNQGKKFSGVLGIEEAKENVCVYDGEVVEGASFTKGIYVYEYQEYNGLGWNVMIANENNTDEINEVPCVKVNDDYVVSMNGMFGGSMACNIDLSNFDTSHVKYMAGMFSNIRCDELNITGLNKIDVGNVMDMNSMFYMTTFQKLDISSFNTSNVTDMGMMFAESSFNKIIGLNSFDTNKVTNMHGMFMGMKVDILDLSSFDITNVTDMSGMFGEASATVGYAKDEATAAKFNDSSVTEIPSTLKFTVKQ